MRIQLKLILALLPATAFSFAIHAGDGRIPVSGSTTITQPGYYYLTRDITFTVSPGIYIAANDVTLDLNGHTLTGPTTAGVYAITATDQDRIRVTNGRIVGGYSAVFINLSAATQTMSVKVDHLVISNTGGIGINVQGGASASILAVIEDNQIFFSPQYPIYVNRMRGGVVSRNITSYGGGIYLSFVHQSNVSDNIVSNCNYYGIYLTNSNYDNLTGNQVTYCPYGIELNICSYNRLVNNITSLSTTFSGVQLDNSNGNVLDGNASLNNQGYGIYIVAPSANNVYSNNRLMNNISSNSFSAGNFSAGGNNAGGANF